MNKRIVTALILILASLGALGVAANTQGCASPGGTPATQPVNDPTAALILANQTLQTAVDTLNGLHVAGAFGNQDWSNIQIAIKSASAALDAWGKNVNSPAAALSAYQAAVLSLEQSIRTGTKKTAPTTQKANQP